MLVPCNTESGVAVVNERLLSIPLVANFSVVAWAGRQLLPESDDWVDQICTQMTQADIL